MFDTEGNYVRWYEQFEAVSRYVGDEIGELYPFDFVPEDERERVQEVLSAVEEGETATVRTDIRTRDGERIPYEFSHARVEVDGETVGYAGIGRDISDRMARERELVENAITHHDRDRPAVELRVRTDENRVVVEVADDGPGISDLERSALLRGHETPLDHATRLGLWFVRWTVTNVGGDIAIEENDPRGSIVRLSLPRAKRVGGADNR